MSSTIFSLEIVVWKLKTEILQLFWCRARPAIIRQYDITNIVLIAIRPYNNTQIMDIIEKYDSIPWYTIRNYWENIYQMAQ